MSSVEEGISLKEDNQKCPFKHCETYFISTHWSTLIHHLTSPKGKEGGHNLEHQTAIDLVDRRRLNFTRRNGADRRAIVELLNTLESTDKASTKTTHGQIHIITKITDISGPLQKDPNEIADKVSMEHIEKNFGKDSRVYQLAQEQYKKTKDKENYMEGFDGFVQVTNLEFDQDHAYNDRKGTPVLKGDKLYHCFCDTCKKASHFAIHLNKYFVCKSNRK